MEKQKYIQKGRALTEEGYMSFKQSSQMANYLSHTCQSASLKTSQLSGLPKFLNASACSILHKNQEFTNISFAHFDLSVALAFTYCKYKPTDNTCYSTGEILQ